MAALQFEDIISDSEENQDKENRQNGFNITTKNKNI